MNGSPATRSPAESESSNRPCSGLLTQAWEELTLAENPADTLWKLVAGLQVIRERCAPEEWVRCLELCQHHALRMLLHQDPYSSRSYRQPRGYPGDAPLIDYLYFARPTEEERVTTSALGIAIFDAAVRTPSAYSVRHRRNVAARTIDMVAMNTSRPSVLSVACGHLREASCSRAMRDELLGQVLAIDQDSESVNVVSAQWSGLGIDSRCLSIGDLIRAGDQVGRFDLIYALGLYDYLAVASARVLTMHLFDLLAEGGTLLVANFVPGIFEAGCMEAFMRWYLVYRTPTELHSLCEVLPQQEISQEHVVLDDFGNIAYLTVVRR
jgi:extracellular factor (EF) 3-hydroxypalmitic acid methyl ester biosynthesis protein